MNEKMGRDCKMVEVVGDSVWRCRRRVISRKEEVGVDGNGVGTVRKIVLR